MFIVVCCGWTAVTLHVKFPLGPWLLDFGLMCEFSEAKNRQDAGIHGT